MNLDFIKMHGIGNDFIFLDNFSNDIQLTPNQVVQLCDRHFGIGADGVVLVEPSSKPDCVAYMHYINADGSIAEMCGNAIRCFAKYLVDHEYVSANAKHFTVDTKAGLKHITFSVDPQGKLNQATVDMGAPILNPAHIPTTLTANTTAENGDAYVKDVQLDSPWGPFSFTCVSMGNPHAVCFIDNFALLDDDLFSDPTQKSLDTFRVDLVGSFFESHEAFPQKTNVEFACIAADGIAMRVYERACGETLACGTGACATSAAASLTKRAPRNNDIHLPGGTLCIEWAADNHIFMTGTAAISFTGTVLL